MLLDGKRACETIAHPREGRDPLFPVRRDPKPSPESGDLNRQIAFFNIGIRPGSIHQSRLGHHLTARLHQSLQQREEFASHRNRKAVLEECAAASVEHEGAEYEALRRHGLSYDLRTKFCGLRKNFGICSERFQDCRREIADALHLGPA